MFRTLIEMNLNQETLPYHIYVIPTCKNFRHLSILKPSENQQRQPTANLPNRSNLMSLAASIPSFFKFFSICLLLALEAFSSADIAHPMIKRNYYLVARQIVINFQGVLKIGMPSRSILRFNSVILTLVSLWSVGLGGLTFHLFR